MAGAIWSKLLVNCSVTTIGAIAGTTLREYIEWPEGRRLFDHTYAEALSVALASGARPEAMIVDPIPPAVGARHWPHRAKDVWLDRLVDGYGDLKPSMLQDFERGRPTEIDFINGYVVELGRRLGVPAPANAAIVDTVNAITGGRFRPAPQVVRRILASRRDWGGNMQQVS
jgi:2-dehydropantoate 2-reductase